MSNLPISSPYRSTPDAPVSEDERNQLSSRLNDAFSGGKLDPDDYRTRLDRLFAAEKLGELLPVVEGLPPVQTYNDPEIVASTGGQPGELAQAKDGSKLTLWVVGAIAILVLLIIILLVVLL